MPSITLGITPFNGDNDYIQRTRECLDQLADVVELPTLKMVIAKPSILLKGRIDIAIINWIENLIVNTETGKISYTGIAILVSRMFLYKFMAKKIIFVRHNIYPHDLQVQYLPVSNRIISWIESNSNLCISHFENFSKDQYLYVPHPLYKIKEKKPYQPDNTARYIIFGRILGYKNLEEIILHFPHNKKLIIAGPAPNKNYLKTLCNLAQGKNIEIIDGYVSNDKIQDLIANSSGVIIPNAGKDMIVSGVYFYAASLGAHTYCFTTPFFSWLRDKKNAPGLTLIEKLDDLSATLKRKSSKNERNLILDFAEKNFGDSEVILHWKMALTKIGLKNDD